MKLTLKAEKTNLITHALAEFQAAGWMDAEGNFEDEMQGYMCQHIINLLEVFSGGGHSGSSAPYAVSLFAQLARFKPIAPLTGEDGEWSAVGDGMFQNKRDTRVFKDASRYDGKAFIIEGIVFWEECEGEMAYFTNFLSNVVIEFPYTPPDKPRYMEWKEEYRTNGLPVEGDVK